MAKPTFRVKHLWVLSGVLLTFAVAYFGFNTEADGAVKYLVSNGMTAITFALSAVVQKRWRIDADEPALGLWPDVDYVDAMIDQLVRLLPVLSPISYIVTMAAL